MESRQESFIYESQPDPQIFQDKFLKRFFLQVIDRLGTIGFTRLNWLSGARTVSSVQYKLSDDDLGELDTMEHLSVGGKEYLRLDRAGERGRLVTLVVGSLGEHQAEELEEAVKRSLLTLNDLVTMSEPRVVPGKSFVPQNQTFVP